MGAATQGTWSRSWRLPQLPPPLPAFQVDELERKVKSQQEQLFLTRQELTHTSAELKMRTVEAEGGTWAGLPLRGQRASGMEHPL